LDQEQDIALLQALREDPIAGLKALHERYYSVLICYAYKFVNSRETAKDLVQDAYLKFFRARGKFRNIPSLESYIFLAVKNLCLSHIRDQKLREKTLQELGGVTLPEDNSNRFIEAEIVRFILLEIKHLPPVQRLVFEMTFHEGLSTGEIAAKLDIKPNNVSQMKRRAADLLRIALLKNKMIDTPSLLVIGLSVWGILVNSHLF